MSEDTTLPELPEPAFFHGDRYCMESCYTADQMRAYAKQAAEAEREACAARIRDLIESHCRITQGSDDPRDHCHPEPGSCEIVDAWLTAIDFIRGQTEIAISARGTK